MLKFSLQREVRGDYQPTRVQIGKWLRRSLQHKFTTSIISISIVDSQTSQELNLDYRGIDKPTNVISLEYAASREQFALLSGELILCDEVIIREAQEQGKPVLAHYAHMIIHGMLHLQGYDHLDEQEANQMEALEINLLQQLGFVNPYQEN